MSLINSDMDGDGDADILAADRVGSGVGAFWIENPGPGPGLAGAWAEHPVGAAVREVVALAETDIDGDGNRDVVAAVRPGSLYLFRRLDASGDAWESRRVALSYRAGAISTLLAGDVDRDGRTDLVVLCEPKEDRPEPRTAEDDEPSVSITWPEELERLPRLVWISYSGSNKSAWEGRPISGASDTPRGPIALIDLDDDRDLDVLTSGERSGAGIAWYENPTR